jgi:ABC-type transport system involved in multi-copper enzyme maturation permease subunit
MNGILRDTFAELFDRKMLYVFVALTVIALLIIASTSAIDLRIRMTGPGETVDEAPSMFVQSAAVRMFGGFVSLLVFLATMASANLIPSALEKGRVEFYLTKPLGRGSFLLKKYVAICIVYGGIVVACGVIVHIVTALMHGVATTTAVYLLGAALINLAIWFSITVTTGVLTRSAPLAIMTAFLIWVAQTILAGHEAIGEFLSSAAGKYLVDGLYYVIPKPSAIFDQASELCLGKSVTDWVPLTSSLAFALAAVGVAIAVLKRKEF